MREHANCGDKAIPPCDDERREMDEFEWMRYAASRVVVVPHNIW
jgi:hypothetical protein